MGGIMHGVMGGIMGGTGRKRDMPRGGATRMRDAPVASGQGAAVVGPHGAGASDSAPSSSCSPSTTTSRPATTMRAPPITVQIEMP